jgi:sulfoxide reductase heme-binding subunit YedZ
MAWTSSTFRRANWPWLTLNLAAPLIMAYVLSQGSRGWEDVGESFHVMLESGKWGVRFLLISLAMTPIQSYLHWNGAIRLRKPAGLWAFAFGALHLLLYAIETWEVIPAWRHNGVPWHWLTWPISPYIALGIVSFVLLSVLAITSNKWSMRRLGKQWKRLHRTVYVAGVTICAHALLATTMSKKVMVFDPNAVPELRLYLGILALLLTLRVPQVRALLLTRTVRVNRMRVNETAQRRVTELPSPQVLPLHTRPTPKLPLPMLTTDRQSAAMADGRQPPVPSPMLSPEEQSSVAEAAPSSMPMLEREVVP